MSAPASSRAGLALLAAITLFWGINWPAMHMAVAEVPVWTFRSICLLAGGGGLLAIAAAARLPLRIPRRELGPLLICAFFNITAWHLMSAAGLTQMAAGRASIIAFTMPLWASLISWPALGERPTARRLAGLALGLVGMAALILPDWNNVVSRPFGVVLMLAAALVWAIGTVGLKYWRWTMPTTVLTGWQVLLGGVPVMIGMLLFDRGFDPVAVSLPGWLALIYAATVPMVFCHWAWFKVVATFPAQLAALGTLAIPIVGVASSSAVLGEPVGLDLVAALVSVVAGLALVVFQPAKRPVAAVAADPGN
jgi:drug/metabolite transporter (DMT)-like permease